MKNNSLCVKVRTYNPDFFAPEELVASFCVRLPEYEQIMESLHACTGNSNIHTLVIGPRGSGKTHLLLRAVAQVSREPELEQLFPILLAEESYEVNTCGEFWLACLDRLADQAPADDARNLRLSCEEIRATKDDPLLAMRCLGALLDFADRHDQRLLLVVENLNRLLAEMAGPAEGWRLRHTLQTEPRILVLGSAPRRFAEIDRPDHALYDLFRVITLAPLNTTDCAVLWRQVTGAPAATRAVRPLEILTGGNPRLLAVMARCGADRSLRALMDNLLVLVDDHTEYFKSHLEALLHQERRVYLALARLWRPATTREVADLARLDTNRSSALLHRPVQRGAVARAGGTARQRQYHLTERLCNMYYLLRRGRGTDRRVKALIEFMICLYEPSEMGEFLEEIARHPQFFACLSPQRMGQIAKVLRGEHESPGTGGQPDPSRALGESLQSLGQDETLTDCRSRQPLRRKPTSCLMRAGPAKPAPFAMSLGAGLGSGPTPSCASSWQEPFAARAKSAGKHSAKTGTVRKPWTLSIKHWPIWMRWIRQRAGTWYLSYM